MMFFTLLDSCPNGAHWNMKKLREASVSNAIGVISYSKVVKVLRARACCHYPLRNSSCTFAFWNLVLSPNHLALICNYRGKNSFINTVRFQAFSWLSLPVSSRFLQDLKKKNQNSWNLIPTFPRISILNLKLHSVMSQLFSSIYLDFSLRKYLFRKQKSKTVFLPCSLLTGSVYFKRSDFEKDTNYGNYNNTDNNRNTN